MAAGDYTQLMIGAPPIAPIEHYQITLDGTTTYTITTKMGQPKVAHVQPITVDGAPGPVVQVEISGRTITLTPPAEMQTQDAYVTVYGF